MIPDTMTDSFPMSVSYMDDDGGGRLSAGCIELRTGSVSLVNGGVNIPRVMLKVYRTSLEHFAVLYPDKLATCCKPIGFINLKNCNVCGWRRTLQIAQRSCDGGVLTFKCADAKDAKMWLDVMENKSVNNTFGRVNSVGSTSTSGNTAGQLNYKSKQMRMNICTNLNLPIVQEEDIDEE